MADTAVITPKTALVSSDSAFRIGAVTTVFISVFPDLSEFECFLGRVFVIGSAGTGKSTLSKQLVSEVSQKTLVVEMSEGRQDVSNISFLPCRVPLIDLARRIQSF